MSGYSPTKDELLAHYESGEVRAYYQLDGWFDFGEGDCVMQPDPEGDVVLGGPHFELRRTDIAVRAYIADGTDTAKAARLLRKFADALETGSETVIDTTLMYTAPWDESDSVLHEPETVDEVMDFVMDIFNRKVGGGHPGGAS